MHFSTATPERFSALAIAPATDLDRLRHHLDRGSVHPGHLIVAVDESGADVGRAGLYTHPDGATVLYAVQVDRARKDPEQVYGALFDGIAQAARATGVAAVEVTVADAQDWAPEAKRAALVSRNWTVAADLLQLEASTEHLAVPDTDIGVTEVIQIDASDPEVIRVMAAAMSDSLDGYDRDRVAAVGAERAASGYRDMMASGPSQVPWLAHRGPDGVTGIAAIQPYPTDWALGYLGVVPQARRSGVGTRLARAMLAATARAGVPVATANVATSNVRIRGTLEQAGFRIASPRTDFVLRPRG